MIHLVSTKNGDLWEKSEGEPALVTEVTLPTLVSETVIELELMRKKPEPEFSGFA